MGSLQVTQAAQVLDVVPTHSCCGQGSAVLMFDLCWAVGVLLPSRGFPSTAEHFGMMKYCEMRFMPAFIFPENEESDVQQHWIPGICSTPLGFVVLWGAPIKGLALAVLPRSPGWEGRVFPTASLPFSCSYN